MRNRLQEQQDDTASAVGAPKLLERLPAWVGLKQLGNDEGTVRLLQTVIGGLFAGFAATVLTLLVLVVAWQYGTDLTLSGMGLVAMLTALAADLSMVILLPRLGLARLNSLKPGLRLFAVATLGFIASLCWGAAVGVAITDDAPPLLLSALMIALGLGLAASLAMPVVALTRCLSATAGVLWTLGSSHELVLVALGGIVLSLMATVNAAVRQHIDEQRGAQERKGRHAIALIDAFETQDKLWFWRTDARGRLSYLTDAGAHRFGRDRNALIGEHFAGLLCQKGDGNFDEQRAEHTLEFQLGAGLPFAGMVVRAPGDTETLWQVTGHPILDDHGRCIGFNGHFAEIGAHDRERADESRLASFDPLTGLPNRASARRSLEELLQGDEKQTSHFVLMLMDLDRFKNVNDTLGHPVGDELLRVVARRLARAVGTSGMVARLGGDEFKILLPNMMDKGEIAGLADTIISRLSLPYEIDGHEVRIGATIGIALAPVDGDCPDELIRNADLALYAAKAAGRGRHCYYHPDMHSNANERRALENDLRDVLGRGELAVLYQPIVDAQSENIVGLEALVRWDHPTRGNIPPGQFIPIAEEIGIINTIGDWVIRTACHEAAAWPDHLRIAINLSPLQFSSPGLMATLVSALADSGLEPDRLELEVTEGVLLNDDPAIDSLFEKLMALGVRLSLDDFGTGYASLAYLQRVPFSKVKIDRSFVRGAAQANSRDHQIFKAMVNLACELGMETVAEGAETLDEIELIRSLGCHQIQGYIFGYPMTAEQARRRSLTEQRRSEHAPREARLGLLRTADMETLGQTHRVKIRNLSASGAMVEAPGDIPIGLTARLTLDDGWEFAGELRWRRGNRFGLQFDESINLPSVVNGPPPEHLAATVKAQANAAEETEHEPAPASDAAYASLAATAKGAGTPDAAPGAAPDAAPGAAPTAPDAAPPAAQSEAQRAAPPPAAPDIMPSADSLPGAGDTAPPAETSDPPAPAPVRRRHPLRAANG